ncbi:quinone-dependent dihydroorotate dehydrogenase [Nibricoccus sp. IMCC34717]|uniref:quinone-dependent dihydroorotate dehydrogenase n=1 Tax=Nibricoccus sp. IMCC34717 TaxID=3034021 RepID=UPI00384D7844
MSSLYEMLSRPLLFRMESERAHEVGVAAMAAMASVAPLRAWLERVNRVDSRAKPVEAFGLQFPNRVGLAAGFDKNGRAWPGAAAMGFGHVEIGTITALQQPGNPRPRVFRYPAEEAVINRMGFNNDGAANVAKRLEKLPKPGARTIPVGVNLGKSKATPLDKATEDYLQSFALLAPYADYLVLNVSSPNTPDLRKLQDEDRLRELLGEMARANTERATKTGGRRLPLLLKIAPDLTWGQIDTVLAALTEFGFDGIIATNTTLARPGYFQSVNEMGGLSGRPLRQRSTEIIRYISLATEGKLPIIGVGGIVDEVSAYEKLDAGATLIQLYTGMIYRGPFFAAELAKGIAQRGLW